jgi:hypothetical protein
LRATGEHACAQVFGWTPGDRSLGQDCARDQDCAPSSLGQVVCQVDVSGGSKRQCMVLSRGGAGDGPCRDDFQGGIPTRLFSCDFYQDLFCDEKSDTCQQRLPAGSPCFSGAAFTCSKTSYCEKTEHVCTPLIAVGGVCCDDTGNCGECVLGAHCNRSSKLCAQRDPIGTPCATSVTCASGDCEDGKCARSPDDVATRCAAL